MDATLEETAAIYPGAQITTLARLVKADGTLISASDLTGIQLQVFERGVEGPGKLALDAVNAIVKGTGQTAS